MEKEESEPLMPPRSGEEVRGVSASPECARVDRLHEHITGTNSVDNPEVKGHVQVTEHPTVHWNFIYAFVWFFCNIVNDA